MDHKAEKIPFEILWLKNDEKKITHWRRFLVRTFVTMRIEVNASLSGTSDVLNSDQTIKASTNKVSFIGWARSHENMEASGNNTLAF